MGILHKLWDETLAGPTPDTGLGKLRKYDSFSAVRSPSRANSSVAGGDQVAVTRSITILRSSNGGGLRNLKVDPCSIPKSPLGSSNPETPLTPETPAGDFSRFTRKKPSSAEADDTSPTAYDWIIISALDR